MADELANFVGRLRDDPGFRRRFAQAPAAMLKALGVDTQNLALPDRIDEDTLVEHLERGGGRAIPPDLDLASLDPKTLWERFGIFGWSEQAAGDDGRGVPVTAVVVYGVAVVFGSVAVVGKRFVASLSQLKVLRDLARAPAEELRFSIKGPDGIAVDDVPADAVAAFLDRLKARPR